MQNTVWDLYDLKAHVSESVFRLQTLILIELN